MCHSNVMNLFIIIILLYLFNRLTALIYSKFAAECPGLLKWYYYD